VTPAIREKPPRNSRCSRESVLSHRGVFAERPGERHFEWQDEIKEQ